MSKIGHLYQTDAALLFNILTLYLPAHLDNFFLPFTNQTRGQMILCARANLPQASSPVLSAKIQIYSSCRLKAGRGSCWSRGLFRYNGFFGQDSSHRAYCASSRGVSAACAQQSNETFPAISATKLTASLTGSPLGGLVRMLSYNCTTCWQGGT